MRQELADQICAAVQWVRCMGAMVNQGIATFVEVGPGRSLTNIARRFSGTLPFLPLEDARGDQLVAIGRPLESGLITGSGLAAVTVQPAAAGQPA